MQSGRRSALALQPTFACNLLDSLFLNLHFVALRLRVRFLTLADEGVGVLGGASD